jgi:S-adenosyl-L-methionine hydrolase (adenosine-forming)
MITLLTDFGTADYFVPAVKGVILSVNPHVQVVDLTHEVPAQDIASGAFTLGACYHNFPAGTVHVAVVDPGVGSERRAIVAQVGGHLFVGPDNGIFSYVYAREAAVRVFHAAREEFFRRPASPTFHGRDVFAPLAAWLSRGLSPEAVGPEIADYVRAGLPKPVITGARTQGSVIHIDRFGNCVTNFTERELTPAQAVTGASLLVGGRRVAQFGTHFAQAARRDELMAYLGSAGYWEVALWHDSAAERLGVGRGAEAVLHLPSRNEGQQ